MKSKALKFISSFKIKVESIFSNLATCLNNILPIFIQDVMEVNSSGKALQQLPSFKFTPKTSKELGMTRGKRLKNPSVFQCQRYKVQNLSNWLSSRQLQKRVSIRLIWTCCLVCQDRYNVLANDLENHLSLSKILFCTTNKLLLQFLLPS